jgi:hypothetical protein
MIRRKSSWKKRALWIAGSLGLAAIVVALLAKSWLLPVIVRWQVQRELSKFCDGQVAVESIEVNHAGLISLAGVELYSKAGINWLHAETIKVALADWPSLSPAINEVEIEGFNLRIFVADGRATIPLSLPSKEPIGTDNKLLNVQKFAVRDASITLIGDKGAKAVYDSIFLSATRKGSSYHMALKRQAPETSDSLAVEGTVEPKVLDMNLSLQVKHAVKRLEAAAILAAMGVSGVSAEGRLTADITITGPLNRPKAWKPIGTVELDGWTVAMPDGTIASELATLVRLKGQYFELDDFTATCCKGRVTGSFRGEVRQDQPIQFGGQILAERVGLPELTSVTSSAKKATSGVVTLRYAFATGDGLKDMRGDGIVFLDDADTNILPVIPNIFRAVGLSNFDPLTMSDVEATFTMAGPVATIKSGHIANRFAAIEADPGGTVNLQTEVIDMYVAAVPLQRLDALLRRIPVIEPFANLRDKLTRLHIKGRWSEPPTKLITKEPIKDLRDGTIGFLRDVVKSGGQLKGTLERVGTVLQAGKEGQK